MDKVLSECFRKWARITKPNGNLSDAYIKKSRNDLMVLRSMPESDMEWKAVTAYYARYHMLTALLAKIGIECKDHNCSIDIAEHILTGTLDRKIFLDIRAAKNHRINLQYYTDRPVDAKEFGMNMNAAGTTVNDIFRAVESLTREEIDSIRRKLT